MPDLPDDTIIVNVPIDAESFPLNVIIRFTKTEHPHHNFAPRTHQQVITLFRRVFGLDYWTVIIRAGLSAMAGDRGAVYSGPDVEDLPLSEQEKSRIIAAL